jgi:hypothetical protein
VNRSKPQTGVAADKIGSKHLTAGSGSSARQIACLRRAGKPGRPGRGIVFGGFKSDMHGTKAEHLDRFAGRAYLRFDSSGHGEAGHAKTGAIFARRCHRYLWDPEPTNEAITQDLKIDANGAGADAIKVTSIEKVNGLMADCWYVLEGHADTYRRAGAPDKQRPHLVHFSNTDKIKEKQLPVLSKADVRRALAA